MSRSNKDRDRLVPIDDAIRSRFAAELPSVIAWREQRLLPGHRLWGVEAVGYGVLTVIGLYFFDWSPMLVFVHLIVTQWIGLLAEILVLRRLGRQGITRLLSAGQMNAFVENVATVMSRHAKHKRGDAEMSIPESVLPDVVTRNDTAKNAHPRGVASSLLFFGILGSGILLVALVYAEGSLRAELLSQPLALALLGGFSLVQLATQFRNRIRPPLPGSGWHVEFTPGLRMFGLVMLALLSPAVLADAEEVRDFALATYGAIAGWGLLTLMSLGMLERGTLRLKEYLGDR